VLFSFFDAFNFSRDITKRPCRTADGLGLPPESLTIKEITFKINSSFKVAGLTRFEWSRDEQAASAFSDAMTADLGHKVAILDVIDSIILRRLIQSPSTSAVALEVKFSVLGLNVWNEQKEKPHLLWPCEKKIHL